MPEEPKTSGPSSALLSVPGGEAAPSLEEAARYLGLPITALNRNFGVVLFDPLQRRYAVEADARSLEGVTLPEGSGPFSAPTIAPMSR